MTPQPKSIGALRRPACSWNLLRPALRLGCVAAVLTAVWCLPGAAHETDQYTVPVGRRFADLGPHLSRVVHAAIVEAVAATNAQIERSLRDGRPTPRTAELQSPEFIAGKVWGRLFAAFPTNEILDGGLASQHTRQGYPGLVTSYRPEQSVHDDPLLLLDVTKMVRSLFRACTVEADGKAFGTDKIIHFIHLGHIYYSTYVEARKRGVDEPVAVAQAVHTSTGNNLLLSENWLLGSFTTGIRSNADLAANYAGFKFYRNLTEPVRLGDQVMAPMLLRQGPYWRLNEQTRPNTDFFTAFVTPHWNEALNPNVYAFGTGARMRSVLRSRCPDILDWYRDEHGRRLTRRQFAEIEDELSTFYGEGYGYEGAGEDEVSIASICFQDDSGAAHADAADTVSTDLHAQTVFGLPSGWGQHPRARVASLEEAPQPVVDELGRTPLWWAARDGRVAEVERRLAQGEDPNRADVDGEGPLHAAARFGRVAVVELLLAHGANPGMQALHGTTALQVAVAGTQIEATRALLGHGANANVRDAFGGSPLHAAVAQGNVDLVALLVSFGADPQAADDGGTTPLQLAARARDDRLKQVLLAHAAQRASNNKLGAMLPGAPQQQPLPVLWPQLTHAESGRGSIESPVNLR